jgi:aminoglycoside phosphotransferase (APT) family kinase protein
VPRPLGFVEEMGLILSEAVETQSAGHHGAGERGDPVTNPWCPQVLREPGGALVAVTIPEVELDLVATALARLHTRQVASGEAPWRSAGLEAQDVLRRAARIAAGNPDQADTVLDLGHQVASRLDVGEPKIHRLAHGSFKPSQILFQRGAPLIIDWDEFVEGDAALDVGSFLAWVRPGGVWYGRSGSREWFDATADRFVGAYRRSMLLREVEEDEVRGILERARLYEASKLFKIAVRRVRWNNSPRAGELAAMCREIAACLGDDTRWSEAAIGLAAPGT